MNRPDVRGRSQDRAGTILVATSVLGLAALFSCRAWTGPVAPPSVGESRAVPALPAPPAPRTKESTMAKVVTWPGPEGVAVSDDYEVTVNGQPLFVYSVPVKFDGPASMATFDCDGPVDVTVRVKGRDVASSQVRPFSRGIAPRVEGDRVAFRLPGPDRLCVETNGVPDRPLYLFANPLETDIPDPADPNVISFGPGVHKVAEKIVVTKDDQTIYLAGGAFVYAELGIWKTKNTRIRGRGILYRGHVPSTFASGKFTHTLAASGCENLQIEGITIMDAPAWTVVPAECNGVTITNLKILNSRDYSTDGINPLNCRDVTIRDCFIRCTDDNISIKGQSYQVPVENILVERCTFWADNNNAVIVGAESMSAHYRNITFRDCDVLQVRDGTEEWNLIKSVMSVAMLHDTDFSDITFEDIRVERFNSQLFAFFLSNEMFGIPGERKERGTVRGVRVRNVSTCAGRLAPSRIIGLGPQHTIEGVSFENLVIDGRPIRSAEEGNFTINEFVRDVRFAPSSPVAPVTGPATDRSSDSRGVLGER